jgi:glyoxylase I family protein
MSPAEVFREAHLRTAVIPGSFPLEGPVIDSEVLGVDHIDLTVTDLGRSLPFYTKLLGALGFRQLVHPHYHGFHNAHLIIGIKEATAEEKATPYTRYRAGLHHLALRAKRKEDVDRFYDWLVAEGVTVLDPPAAYPQYGPHYYAVFFADPDGLKLELVYYPVPWGYWQETQMAGADPRPRSEPGEER